MKVSHVFYHVLNSNFNLISDKLTEDKLQLELASYHNHIGIPTAFRAYFTSCKLGFLAMFVMENITKRISFSEAKREKG